MSDLIIPQSKTKDTEYLNKGVYLVKVTDVQKYLTPEGLEVKDRNGNPCLKVTLIEESSKKKFIDRIYYGSEKVQWVLDAFIKALGADNTQGGLSKDAVIGKEAFVAIENVTYVDESGNPTTKDNGDPRSFASRKRYYKVIDRNTPPVIDTSILERTILDTKSKTAPAPVPTNDEPAPF